MTQETNNNHLHKCPNCACVFLTYADLQKHINVFGTVKEQHDYTYKKTHGRLEHGYDQE